MASAQHLLNEGMSNTRPTMRLIAGLCKASVMSCTLRQNVLDPGRGWGKDQPGSQAWICWVSGSATHLPEPSCPPRYCEPGDTCLWG